MAAPAVFECQVAPEGTFTVVAGKTSLPASRREMLSNRRRADLARLRCARSEAMAISAFQSLARPMFRMAKRETKRTRIGRGASIGFLLMTNSAGSNLSARCRLAGRSVTAVTLVVGPDARRNTKRGRTPSSSTVASGASILRPRRATHMLRVIKLHIEALVEPRGKTFLRRV